MTSRSRMSSLVLAVIACIAAVGCVEELEAVKGAPGAPTAQITPSGGAGGGGAPPASSAGAGGLAPAGTGGTGAAGAEDGAGGTGAGVGGTGAGVGGTAAGAGEGGSAGGTTEPVSPPPTELTVVAQGFGGPLVVDDTWLFIGVPNGVPVRVNKGGGTPVPVATGPDATEAVLQLALDSTHLYWFSFANLGYRVWRAPKGGGAAQLLTSGSIPSFAYPAALEVDDSHVYISLPDRGNVNDLQNRTGEIRRIPKEGGPSTKLFDVYASLMVQDGGDLYWNVDRPDGGGELWKGAKDGSSAAVFRNELGRIEALGARGGRLYWSFLDAGWYFTRSVAPGASEVSLAPTENRPGPFAIGEAGAYWLAGGDNLSGRVWLQGLDGSLKPIATAPATSNQQLFAGAFGSRIAIDEGSVYWAYEGAQGGAPRVYRLAR